MAERKTFSTQTRRAIKKTRAGGRNKSCRAGAASIDYFLVMGVVVVIAAFTTFAVPRMIRLVYEMTVTLVGSPLM